MAEEAALASAAHQHCETLNLVFSIRLGIMTWQISTEQSSENILVHEYPSVLNFSYLLSLPTTTSNLDVNLMSPICANGAGFFIRSCGGCCSARA